MNINNLYDFFFQHLKKVFYPEEWIKLDWNFSKTEIFTMLLVERHGEIIMSQIAEHIHLPMSTASGLVERLVKNGYLKRERSESDRRIVVIKLTDKGKALVAELKDMIFHYIEKIGESLTKEEVEVLGKVFTKAIEVINDINKEKDHSDDGKESNSIKKIEIE
ncbi:DNA-binding transcriptional regulator, MarR family [Natronincola peptidivorans]|uniref:DNA-binding transcriptional regulator, MarR family n=1 Tax=Natronincola peptidivorans TaxID=426128 RepID=A0A1I0CET1_9FIRM|nr:MarR family transcriptional regulator [Natronincola peptidivorans]SET17566.1 DNA-binding transcriptional regulator, MarR family [Natronincola peptidivorans]